MKRLISPTNVNEYVCAECDKVFYAEYKYDCIGCPFCGSDAYLNEEDIRIKEEN